MTLTRDELVSRIESIERAESQARARALARRLQPYVATLDTDLRQKLLAALESMQLDPTLARAPVALGVGQAWLLLHAGGRDGHVARLVVETRSHAERERTPSSATATYVTDAGIAAPLHALATVAARACRALPVDLRDGVALRIASSHGPGFAMVGSSFQLSAAVALASHALGCAPIATCAGTATVQLDGTLGPVTHVAEKVAALRLDFPEIRTVVVAEGQEVTPVEGVAFVRGRTLGEALPVFGLEIERLGPSPLEDHLTRAASFNQTNKKGLTPDHWRARSLEAWESCVALEEQEAQASAGCRAWAALFAVHAGDEQHARAIAAGANRTVLEENPGLGPSLGAHRRGLRVRMPQSCCSHSSFLDPLAFGVNLMKLSFNADEHLELQDALPTLDAHPHQSTTWDKMDRHYLEQAKPAGLVVLPTGGGKTVVAAHWLLRNVIARGGRVLWLANRQALLRQAFKTFEALANLAYPEKRTLDLIAVSSEFAKWSAVSRDHEVIFASVQSSVLASNRGFVKELLADAGKKAFVVVDEAHHAVAPRPLELLAEVKREGVRILGLTATPIRMDDQDQRRPGEWGPLQAAVEEARALGIEPGTGSSPDFWRVRSEMFLDTFERYFEWKRPGSMMAM